MIVMIAIFQKHCLHIVHYTLLCPSYTHGKCVKTLGKPARGFKGFESPPEKYLGFDSEAKAIDTDYKLKILPQIVHATHDTHLYLKLHMP